MSVHEDTAILKFSVDNYEQKLVRKLHKLAQSDQFCDVILISHEKTVHTHRAVLCASSQYFATLFSDRWSPSVTHDVTHLFPAVEQLEDFVRFMYTGKIKISNDNIDDVLNAGTHLLVDDLRDVCAKYLAANLSPFNCLPIWLLSLKYHLQEVALLCQAIATSRFPDYLIHRDDILDLDLEFLDRIVSDGVLDHVAEDERVRFLTNWEKHKKERKLSDRLRTYLPSSPHPSLSSMSPTSSVESISSDENMLTDTGSASSSGEEELAGSDPCTDDQLEVITDPNTSVSLPTSAPPSPIHHKHFTSVQDPLVEAIFASVSRSCYIDMYVYLKSHNRWKNLGTFSDTEFGLVSSSCLVGFLGSLAIYDDGLNNCCSLVDFETKSVKSLQCPNTGYSPQRAIFCMKGKIFLVQGTGGRRGKTGEIHVFVLNPQTMQWEKELGEDFVKLFPDFDSRSKITFTVVTSGGKAFIWAQDMSSNTSGPYWLVLELADDNLTLLPLSNPPLATADLRLQTPMSIRGWKHANFKFSVDTGFIYLYHTKSFTTKSMTYNTVLIYNLKSDTWERKENITINFPQDIDVPVTSRLISSPTHKSYIQLDQKCKIQSCLDGCVYMMEKVCPFVTRLWSHRFCDGGKWEQMAPPPVENISTFGSFSVISLARSVSDSLQGSTSYNGVSDDSHHSPMMHWQLDVKGSSKIDIQSPAALIIQQCSHA